MKHVRPFLLSLSALLLGSCTAPPDQSIIVTEARAPGQACDFSDPTKYVEGGAIDLAAFGENSTYIQIFGWENDLQNISVSVNGQQITSETTNTFIATSIKLNYQVVGATIPTPPPGVVNVSATIPPGGTPSTNTVGVYLLDQTAAQTICGPPEYVLPDGGYAGLLLPDGGLTQFQDGGTGESCPGLPAGSPSVNMLVTFQLSGALVGGGAAQTNPVTFPLTLSNYGGVAYNGNCKPGYIPQETTCNIPGRDLPYCIQ